MRDKLKAEISDSCKRLGDYRQTFAWSALQVFDLRRNLLLPTETVFDRIYSWTTKDEILTALQSPEFKVFSAYDDNQN